MSIVLGYNMGYYLAHIINITPVNMVYISALIYSINIVIMAFLNMMLPFIRIENHYIFLYNYSNIFKGV